MMDAMASRPARTQPRQERSQRRRDAIVRAAAELATENGFAAVSHRGVAERAGVPLGSTTYYFSCLDDLLGEAAAASLESWVAHGAEVIANAGPGPYDPGPAAELVVRALLPGTDYATVLCYYEQILGSARHPAVAEVLRSGRSRLEGMIAEALDTTGFAGRFSAGLALGVVDGAVLSALSEGRRDVAGFATDLLAELFSGA